MIFLALFNLKIGISGPLIEPGKTHSQMKLFNRRGERSAKVRSVAFPVDNQNSFSTRAPDILIYVFKLYTTDWPSVVYIYIYILVDPLAGVETNRSLVIGLPGLLVNWLTG